MENGTVKQGELSSEAPETATDVTPAQPLLVTGKVVIELKPDGSLGLSTPPNQLIALAILEAGKSYLLMQMQDAMRRATVAPSPMIVRGSDNLVKQVAEQAGLLHGRKVS